MSKNTLLAALSCNVFSSYTGTPIYLLPSTRETKTIRPKLSNDSMSFNQPGKPWDWTCPIFWRCFLCFCSPEGISRIFSGWVKYTLCQATIPTKPQSLPIKGAWDDLPLPKPSQWHCRKGAWKWTCWLWKGSTWTIAYLIKIDKISLMALYHCIGCKV